MSESVQVDGRDVTVKVELVAPTPPTVTSNVPEEAPVGTMAVMLEADQLVTTALVELRETVLLACVAPKFDPAIVTGMPTGPEVGEIAVIVGDCAYALPQQTTTNNIPNKII
jgi:hypothetical protein